MRNPPPTSLGHVRLCPFDMPKVSNAPAQKIFLTVQRRGMTDAIQWAVDNMHELQIQTQQMHGIQIVRLVGAVEALNFEKLAAVLDKMLQETPPRVILDCTKVEYVGSAQLKGLADVARC